MRWTVIVNCDSFFITKCDTVYYKLRQVLISAIDLLQISTGITKCDDYYKLRQYRSTMAEEVKIVNGSITCKAMHEVFKRGLKNADLLNKSKSLKILEKSLTFNLYV